MIEIWAIIAIITCTIIGSFGSLFFKLGSKDLSLSFKIIYNWRLIIGFFLYGLSAVIYTLALRFGELSIIYPLVSISYIWVAILSSVVLREKITRFKLIGMGLIIFGVILIGISS
jgi:uncharacterized membrane protein